MKGKGKIKQCVRETWTVNNSRVRGRVAVHKKAGKEDRGRSKANVKGSNTVGQELHQQKETKVTAISLE